MLSVLGSIFIALPLFATLFASYAIGRGSRREDPRWLRAGQRALDGSAAVLFMALLLLMGAFLTDQFQIAYVALHSSSALPVHLKLSALWAGQEGSLLLWAFLQTLFAALVARRATIEEAPLTGWASILLGIMAAFFIAMTLFFSNPFQLVVPAPVDGQGMNPLLRHPGMIFHPPVLYIGYVGLAVPFAYAIAALIVGKIDAWPKEIRRWLLISWVALGLGIFLGARWAYDVLGWGGYWGWDAVENAGLMPWLTATALLHGLDMQTRGKGFKVWNVSLAVISFALVLFGTFTTRSGWIQSVHAFGRSQLGPYFLAMIGVVLIGSLVLMIARRKVFGELIYPEKVFSREGAFFFTLLLLMLITLSILMGTLLPTLTDGRFSAPPAWFNQVVGPQLGALVLLMGICPLLGRWIGQAKRSFWRAAPPLAGAFGMALAAVLLGYTRPAALMGLAVAGFAGGSALGEIGFTLAAQLRKTKGGHVSGQHGLGGHLVHLGVVLMAIGVIGTQMYATEQNVTLAPGDRVRVGDYELLYEALFQETANDHLDTWVSIPVYRDSAYLTTLTPKILYYPAYQQTMAEPAIRSGLGEDLYLVMFQWDSSGQVSLSAMVNPLSMFLWVGGFVLLIGGGLAWWPSSASGDGETERKQRVLSQIAAAVVLIVILLLVVALWGNTLGLSGGSGRPLPGQAAPNFSAVDLAESDFSLSDHTGEVVVVHFWATWCDQCETEMAELEIAWQTYQAQGVQFVGVAMADDPAAVTEMAVLLGLTLPLIVEEEDAITSSYGVTAVPETFIIDRDGNVAYFHIGAVSAAELEAELESLLANE